MEEERVKKLKRQFNKQYFDTSKHCLDIEKWIRNGNRKQGDIRRSLNRLTKKYESLYELKKELGRNNITEEEMLNNISSDKDTPNLSKIKSTIDSLYKLAELENIHTREKEKAKSIYGNEIELVSDIEEYYRKRESNQPFLETAEEKNIAIITNGRFKRIQEKIKDKMRNFKKSRQKKEKNKIRIIARVGAVAMASVVAFLGGITAGEKENPYNNKNIKNDKSYIDTNKEKNEFKRSIYFQTLDETNTIENKLENYENTENVKETIGVAKESKKEQNKIYNKESIDGTERIESIEKIESINKIENKKNTDKIERKEKNNRENKENSEEVFVAHANTKYTEVSDGSGNIGRFSKDTKVKVYNRALIKTDRNGHKTILRYTKAGQSWKEFAKENGISNKELKKDIENSKDIDEYVSVQSEDGKRLYGWISTDKLEKTEEMER